MKIKSAIIGCAILCLSSNLSGVSNAYMAKRTTPLRLEGLNGTYNIISSYDSKNSIILLQFNLTEESIVALELYDQEGKMIKVWNPEVAESGIYKSSISVQEVPDGTYLMNIIINKESYQQAVFKY